MEELIEKFFKSENIEYYSSVKASKLKVINERKMPQGIKSAVIFLIPYNTFSESVRNVSVYAESYDYHLYFKELSERFIDFVGEKAQKFHFFCDSSPIDEIKAAHDARLGFFGENRLLINEKYGSYFFIGEFLCEDEILLPNVLLKRASCRKCGLCRNACPFLDGKEEFCMSEITQKKHTEEYENEKIKSHYLAWGCDKCQEICPENKNISPTPISFFYENKLEFVTEKDITDMGKSEFAKRAYGWRKKEVILRNLSLQNK